MESYVALMPQTPTHTDLPQVLLYIMYNINILIWYINLVWYVLAVFLPCMVKSLRTCVFTVQARLMIASWWHAHQNDRKSHKFCLASFSGDTHPPQQRSAHKWHFCSMAKMSKFDICQKLLQDFGVLINHHRQASQKRRKKVKDVY